MSINMGVELSDPMGHTFSGKMETNLPFNCWDVGFLSAQFPVWIRVLVVAMVVQQLSFLCLMLIICQHYSTHPVCISSFSESDKLQGQLCFKCLVVLLQLDNKGLQSVMGQQASLSLTQQLTTNNTIQEAEKSDSVSPRQSAKE